MTAWPMLLVLLCVHVIAAQESAPEIPEVQMSLSEAIAVAAGQAPGVTIARLDARSGRALVQQQRGTLLPRIHGTIDYSRREFVGRFGGGAEVIGPLNEFDARLRLGQSIIDLEAWNRYGAVRFQRTAADAAQSLAIERAAESAAAAYIELVRSLLESAARQEDLALARKLLELAQAHVEAGAAESIDLTRAQTQFAGIQTSAVQATNAVDQARITLLRILDLDVTAPLQVTSALDDALAAAEVPTDPQTAIASALSQRSELAIARAQLAGIRAERDAVSAEVLPRANVYGDYGLNGAAPDDTDPTWQVGVQVIVPIVDGFAHGPRLERQDLAVRREEVRLRDQEREIVAEVHRALLDLASANAQRDVAQERLRLADLELRQSTERFQAGAAGNIDVINAQLSLILARNADISARSAAALSRVRLARAVGAARTLR